METGFTTISSKGQIVIPQRIRELLKLREGTSFIVEARDDTILMKKVDIPKIKSWDEATAPFKEAANKVKFTEKDLKRTLKEIKSLKK